MYLQGCGYVFQDTRRRKRLAKIYERSVRGGKNSPDWLVVSLANPEFYSHLASWRVVIRTPGTCINRTFTFTGTKFSHHSAEIAKRERGVRMASGRLSGLYNLNTSSPKHVPVASRTHKFNQLNRDSYNNKHKHCQ
jgi:hypothetical protein